MFPELSTIKTFSYSFAMTMLSYPEDFKHLKRGILLIFCINSTKHSVWHTGNTKCLLHRVGSYLKLIYYKYDKCFLITFEVANQIFMS